MLEAARMLAGFSVALLVVAFAAWANPLGRAQLRRLNGRTTSNVDYPQIAAVLLFTAVGSSAVAAILAIAGWFTT